MREEAKRRNRKSRYGEAGSVPEPRLPEELKTVRDCTEEILWVVVDAYNASPTTRDPEVIQANRGGLYDRVEAIIQRAQALALEGAPGNQPQSE